MQRKTTGVMKLPVKKIENERFEVYITIKFLTVWEI